MNMKFAILSLAIFGACFCPRLNAQNYIFEGIIGKKEAILGFEQTGKEINNAQYYLQSNKEIINLETHKVDSQTLFFYTLDANNEDTFSQFFLTFGENNMTLNGKFKANDNISESAYFTWLDITKIEHNFDGHILSEAYKSELPFLYVYTSQIKFNKAIRQIKSGKYDALTLVKNWPNDIPSIRFVNANAAEKKIEKFCDSVGLEQVIASLDCSLDYDVEIEVKRFDRTFISLLYKVSWNCGGSNKDFYFQGYSFNRLTGEQILLSDLFVLKDEQSSNDSLNKIAIKDNEQIIRNMVSAVLINGGSSLCNYDSYPLFGDKNFYLTSKEIHFLPIFPKGLGECRSSEKSKVTFKGVQNQLVSPYQQMLIIN